MALLTSTSPGVWKSKYLLLKMQSWEDALTGVGIGKEDAAKYASTFVENEINTNNIQKLDRDILTELGIKNWATSYLS